MSTCDSAPAVRLPVPGDLVTVTGVVLYRVTEVSEPYSVPGRGRGDGTRLVRMVGTRSGRRSSEFLGRLSWPKSDAGGLGPSVVPLVPLVAPRGAPSGGGAGGDVDGGQAAAVVSWDAPQGHDAPSSVGLCWAQDSTGRFFLHVTADGPTGDAYIDRASALALASHLSALLAPTGTTHP